MSLISFVAAVQVRTLILIFIIDTASWDREIAQAGGWIGIGPC